MKKKLRLILCCLLLSVSLAGCAPGKPDENSSTYKRLESDEILTIDVGKWDYIYVHKRTGVQYLFINNNNGAAGLTVLVDADGKPILYEGDM